MKLVIEKDSFIKSLSKVQGIVEKRNAMPILSNTLLKVRDNQLEIIATDLEVTIIDRCPVDVREEGSLTLNAKKLFDIARECGEGPVSLTADKDNRMEVKSGNLRYELMGLGTDDFPKVPNPSGYKFTKIPAPAFLEMAQKTIYASAGEDTRYSLNGIFIEKFAEAKKLRMVATDGHRLAMVERELAKLGDLTLSEGVILPRKGMNEVSKLLTETDAEIGVSIQQKMAAFSLNDTFVFMRLVDGKFPDYRRVIVEGADKKARINKEELIKNLRHASVMVDEKARAVKFGFSTNKLSLESKNPNFGSHYSEMAMEYDGSEIVMAFNDRYFIDIMAVSKSETIRVELKDDQSPAIVKLEEDPDYTCVIMPMRF
jgi:DNA polymerase-3 subunit beta